MRAIEDLNQILLPAVQAAGYELWGYQYFPNKGKGLLRVYIDSPQGVTLAACEQASYQISAVLDVEAVISGSYELEVSSPGIERPLFLISHYENNLGKTVKVKLYEIHGMHKVFYGKIMEVRQDRILFELDSKERLEVTLAMIKKAALLPAANSLFSKRSKNDE